MTAEDETCAKCGCADRTLSVMVQDQLSVTEGCRLEQRRGERGAISPHVRVSDELKWNADRGRRERRRMVVDREHNAYSQTWSDPQTGEMTWHKEGRLDDPDMHGASSRRSSDPDEERD